MPSRVVLAAALATLVLAPPASAGIYERVLSVYEAEGQIPACQFSSQELTAALKGVDTYGAQYFADFTQAVQTALAQRAGGDCASAPVRPAPTRRPSALAALRLPASPTSSSDSGLPAPILLMLALALAAAAAASWRALMRQTGWEPAWAAGWRHVRAEAGYRAGARLEQLRDVLRRN